jgi:hypothetical protein
MLYRRATQKLIRYVNIDLRDERVLMSDIDASTIYWQSSKALFLQAGFKLTRLVAC